MRNTLKKYQWKVVMLVSGTRETREVTSTIASPSATLAIADSIMTCAALSRVMPGVTLKTEVKRTEFKRGKFVDQDVIHVTRALDGEFSVVRNLIVEEKNAAVEKARNFINR